ncbi:MAG: VOC family protein [Candidatus Kapabacteria bacterium]|jgi:predicted enzyme related to lactoylglutathione lyase|nr:VOC family protein [Candidatus Kapabacteria bacterium]
MIQGLRTVIYAAPNLAEAKSWYAKAFGIQPYFDEPFYVGFSINGFELGLDPNIPLLDGSTVTYWSVDDITTAHRHFLAHGAKPRSEPENVGGDIWTATVFDPFGNAIGLIAEP